MQKVKDRELIFFLEKTDTAEQELIDFLKERGIHFIVIGRFKQEDEPRARDDVKYLRFLDHALQNTIKPSTHDVKGLWINNDEIINKIESIITENIKKTFPDKSVEDVRALTCLPESGETLDIIERGNLDAIGTSLKIKNLVKHITEATTT